VAAAGNAGPPRPRLAELIAALSLGIDLGFGQPMEHVLRQCVIALRLAEREGLDEDDRLVVYYTALLVNVGCHSDAHEQAKWFGDDIALKADKYRYELRGARSAAHGMRRIGSGSPPLHRFRVGLEFALKGYRDLDGMVERHAALAAELARRIGLPEAVQQALAASYEMWDGKGWPGKLGGTDIPIAARVSQFAEFMEVAHRIGGVDAATALARSRSGTQFDPEVVTVFCSGAVEILGELDTTSTWAMVVDSEPALGVHLSDDEVDHALDAIAAFVDLKSPYFLGHSRAVAELVGVAGTTMGFDAADLRTLRRAGLAHGLGRLGISNSIWDKPGPLGAGERERVRMHPYLNERMLQQSPALAPLAAITVQFRERLDGSGYPRQLTGGAISNAARVLAAADAYQAMREPRPHRAERDADTAAAELRREAGAGRLDGDAVDAVLEAAGQPVGQRRDRPAGLTAREVEVLRLVSRGLSSREIAGRLVISPKTARNHIEHIYTKIGASSRVNASLFAIQHGLLPVDAFES
jgi:HD-GYP domain-containing protein (c-di-GMP phosphodiesterase class II)